jgi:hypothetical protein
MVDASSYHHKRKWPKSCLIPYGQTTQSLSLNTEERARPISRNRFKTGFMNGLVAGTGNEVIEMVGRVGVEPTAR